MAVQQALRIFISGLSNRFGGLKRRVSAFSNFLVVSVLVAISDKVEVEES